MDSLCAFSLGCIVPRTLNPDQVPLFHEKQIYRFTFCFCFSDPACSPVAGRGSRCDNSASRERTRRREFFRGGSMGMRDAWIEKRLRETAAANGSRNVSQMHYARHGVITQEMAFVAGREKIETELVRSEIA